MPATTYVSAVTEGNLITITSTKDDSGVVTKTKVVRTKKQCYSNITGTKAAPVFSIIDHKGNTIFTKEFSGNTQSSVTHSINTKVTYADIWAEFNTWNGGVGVTALQPERVYAAKLTQTSGVADYTIVKNTLGSDINWATDGTGVVSFTVGTKFSKSKAVYTIETGITKTEQVLIGTDSDKIKVTTSVLASGAYTETANKLAGNAVTIRVQH